MCQFSRPFIIRASLITLSSNFSGAHSSMLFLVAVTSVGRYTCSGSFMVSRYLIGGKFIMSKTRKSRREGGESANEPHSPERGRGASSIVHKK